MKIFATLDYEIAFEKADYVVICTPTDYDDKKNFFDTESIETTIQKIKEISDKSHVVIKSTIPIGYTSKIIKKFNKDNIVFSPEFLREGKALHDNLYPTRIVVGCDVDSNKSKSIALEFANILKDSCLKKEVDTHIVSFEEAESIKLFSNAYLAMRVAFLMN